MTPPRAFQVGECVTIISPFESPEDHWHVLLSPGPQTREAVQSHNPLKILKTKLVCFLKPCAPIYNWFISRLHG